MSVHIGRIVVGDLSEARLRSAFPDCEIAAVGADFQITVQLRDLADVYPFLDRVRQTGASLISLSITDLS
jgi:hypothetical protein